MGATMVVQAHVKPAHAGRDPIGRSESDEGLNGNASAVTAVVDAKSRVRFATTRALFETFPELLRKIGDAPTDQCPIDFLRGLAAQGRLGEAVTVCAFLLPRREAVWWACRCARAPFGDIRHDRAHRLLAAEAWVREPTDARRRAALSLASDDTSSSPLTWLALAAGWSGGSLSAHPKMLPPMPPYLTARAVRIAVLLSGHALEKDRRAARLQTWIAEAAEFAEKGLGHAGIW
jgi:hypothetical protein